MALYPVTYVVSTAVPLVIDDDADPRLRAGV